MTAEKMHLGILNFLPIIGFAIYGMLTGFSNPLFWPIYLTGWIIVVVYQAILTVAYKPPRFAWLALIMVIITPAILITNALIKNSDIAIAFIEMAAIDLLGLVIGFIIAVIYKLMKEGAGDAPIFALVFTIALFCTAAFFLVKLILLFFEMEGFDLIVVGIVAFGVIRSAAFFATRLNELTNRLLAKEKAADEAPAREIAPELVLITIGIWLAIIPLLTWIASLIMGHQ